MFYDKKTLFKDTSTEKKALHLETAVLDSVQETNSSRIPRISIDQIHLIFHDP